MDNISSPQSNPVLLPWLLASIFFIFTVVLSTLPLSQRAIVVGRDLESNKDATTAQKIDSVSSPVGIVEEEIAYVKYSRKDETVSRYFGTGFTQSLENYIQQYARDGISSTMRADVDGVEPYVSASGKESYHVRLSIITVTQEPSSCEEKGAVESDLEGCVIPKTTIEKKFVGFVSDVDALK
jgi:hypothetical protein